MTNYPSARKIVLSSIGLILVAHAKADLISTGFGLTATSSQAGANPITLTYSVTNNTGEEPNTASIVWSSAAQTFLAAGIPAKGKTKKSTTQAANVSEAAATMDISFPNPQAPHDKFAANAFAIGPARAMLVPQPGNPLSLVSTFTDADSSELQLTSTIEAIGAGLFEYTDEVQILSGFQSTITFSWDSAAISSGSVSPGIPFVKSFTSSNPGIEVIGDASFMFADGQVIFLATAIQPVPEPSSGALVGIGAILCSLSTLCWCKVNLTN